MERRREKVSKLGEKRVELNTAYVALESDMLGEIEGNRSATGDKQAAERERTRGALRIDRTASQNRGSIRTSRHLPAGRHASIPTRISSPHREAA
eukprot:5241079-Amphidinium_carterae.1